MRAVILAGGKGTRLLPYTAIVPKPLMPVGEQAIVEILIRQLRNHGCRRITVALGHLAHLVQAVLGNGDQFGVTIDYSVEDSALGTSGPLGLMKHLDDTFLVLNGDVLTNMDFTELKRFHKENGFIVTVACHERSANIDYGVIHNEGSRIVRYEEKPVMDFLVSTGVYVFEPGVLKYIEPGAYLDFPNLVNMLLENGETVGCYPFDGTWFDLGRVEDFQKVHELWDELKNDPTLLPSRL
jgi:NDP-mannose synthase